MGILTDIDTKKAFEKYKGKNKDLIELQNQKALSGKQQMKELVEKFDRYTGMKRYNYSLLQENVSIIDA